MARIDSYTALTQALPAWLNAATADISSVLAEIVDNAEKRIFREIRTPEMETSLSVNVSGGVATIPTDFMELKYAYVDTNPVTYIQLVPTSYIFDRYPTRGADGVPVVLARDGASWIFGPYPDSDYVIKGTYYKTPSSIGTGTNNALMSSYGDLYLYASLCESEPMIGRDKRMAIWESKYRLVKELINGVGDRSRFSGNMQIRVG
jgi:hypothetical protein